MVRAFFAPELGKWVSSWEGWKMVKKVKKKVLRMKFSIVENVPTSRDSIFKLSPASQRPPGAKIFKKKK